MSDPILLAALGLLIPALVEAQPARTTRVSVASDGTQFSGSWSFDPSISADGRFVAFDSNDNAVYVHDRLTGTTSYVGAGIRPSISGDGRFVAFDHHSYPSYFEVFVHDRLTGTTTRVSVATDGAQTDGNSERAAISSDGRFVAFISEASNLVTGDTNGRGDVFVHDRLTATTTRVSVATDGSQANDTSSFGSRPSISGNGRFVAFESSASNLVADDTNGWSDVFVHDRLTRATTRVSIATDGTQGNSFSRYPAISADGRFVAFVSGASNLVSEDTNGWRDVFSHDRQTGTTTRVGVFSVNRDRGSDRLNTGTSPSLSSDGRFVAFASYSTDLVYGDTNGTTDAFVYDHQTGATTRVSVASDGSEANTAVGPWPGYSARVTGSYSPSISADGRHVAFVSFASNLVQGDTNNIADIFVRDRGRVTEGPDVGDVPVAIDYDGDTKADLAVYRQTTGEWFILRSPDEGLTQAFWGAPALDDVPVPADYDGDGLSDLAVYRTSSGEWFIARSTGGLQRESWGAPSLGDVPVSGDYDGDGRADVAVYRSTTGEWFLALSGGGSRRETWGAPSLGDTPVPADYDGDHRSDVAIYRSSTGQWFILHSSTRSADVRQWGSPALGDIPVPTDYDGDGRADVAVYRASSGEWFVQRSGDGGTSQVDWGAPALGDVPEPADYDGDGRADIAVYRQTTWEWFVHRSLGTGANWPW